MKSYHYEVKMKNEEIPWKLDIIDNDRISAGIQIWNKIQNEGRSQDVVSVFIISEKELN